MILQSLNKAFKSMNNRGNCITIFEVLNVVGYHFIGALLQ